MNFSRNYIQDGDVRILEIHGGSAPNVVPAEAKAKVVCPAELAASLLKKSDDRIQYEKTEEGVQITAAGLSAHGATPELGVNAIGLLLEALCELPLSEEADRWVRFLEEKIGLETKGTSLGIEMADEISGNLSLNLGTLEGDDHSAALEINYRYPVTKSYEDCAPILEQAFADAGFTKTGSGIRRVCMCRKKANWFRHCWGYMQIIRDLNPYQSPSAAVLMRRQFPIS